MTTLTGHRHLRPVTGVAVLLAVVGAMTFSVARFDSDSGRDLANLTRSAGVGLAGISWPFAAAVLALTGLHYVAAAVAARAAATAPLKLGEAIQVQLAAATANRVAPGGVGGAAVNARYFTRRGMDGRAAIGAVAMLTVLGAIADLVVFLLLVSVGQLLGLGGGAAELRLLGSKLAGVGRTLQSVWTLVIVVGAVVAIWVMVRAHRRTPAVKGRYAAPFTSIRQRPKELVVLLVASGSTTLILAFAFVATNAMVAGPQPRATVGAVLIAYMTAAAAGNVIPIPSGLGSTEAAMVAVLVAAQVPTAHAVGVVLTYRLLTFWLPAVVGIALAWRLRRAGVL